MSKLAEQFGQLGDTLETAIGAEVDRKTFSLREAEFQLDSIRRQLLAEKVLSDHRFETLSSKLDKVLMKLGTNGSGGHAP